MKTPHLDTVAAAALAEQARAWSSATLHAMGIGARRSPQSRDHLLERAIVTQLGNLAAVIVSVMTAPTNAMRAPAEPLIHWGDTIAEATDAARAGSIPVTSIPGDVIVPCSLVPDETLALYRDLQAAALQAVEASEPHTLTNDTMHLPVRWFELLVLIAGKVEMEDAAAVMPTYDELAERHIEAVR